MLANLPVEVILLICQYPEFKELRQLAWTNKRMMQIIKKCLPTALDGRILFYLYYWSDGEDEGRICLFNSSTCSVEEIAKFRNWYEPFEVATTQNKIFGINGNKKSFEIYDLDTRQTLRGPDPPEWHRFASVAYFKDKLYYLGGKDPETEENTNRVDVLIDGKWKTGPAFPLPIRFARAIISNEILYVIDGWDKKIYRLSDDEREWIEIGEVPEKRGLFGAASLDGKIYIAGGYCGNDKLKSCLCFDPSAPVDSRISRIADMNCARYNHSLIVANGKLYAIGGYQNSIEEHDPQTNKWYEVGILSNLSAASENVEKKTRTNRTKKGTCLLS